MVKIVGVSDGSPAQKRGVVAGDVLTHINGYEINDVLDYRFRLTESKVKLHVLRNGKKKRFVIKKAEDDTDIGLEFETPLMDGKHSCRNKCIFCFIDQNPEGMRESCYFKDDDSRLSFLHGNYITLTNLSRRDVERIIEMHISPVNVSVHTTNPELRCKMMNNRFAGETLEYLDMFAKAGIAICAQIVLCRGINDGAELERTMHDLISYLPALDSVSVVPAGLTKYRDGLFPLTTFTREESRAVVGQVTQFGDACVGAYGRRIFYCSDEFYVNAGLPLPDEAFYEEFSQLEDGVGMLTLFESEAEAELQAASDEAGGEVPEREISVATGYAAYDMLSRVCRKVETAFPCVKINVYKIRNDFFGESVTVAGLLTAGDIAAQLSGKPLGEAVCFSRNALRAEGDLFLDNASPEELSQKLGVPALPIENDGGVFIRTVLNLPQIRA